MDSLLKKFNEDRSKDPEVVSRAQIKEDFEDSNPFELKWNERDYNGQFHHMYQYRLTTLRSRVESECQQKWDNGFKLNGKPVVKKEKVLDVQANEPCWCIGTVYCEMKYKPNVLEEVVNDTYGAPDLVKSYMDPEGEDQVMLEDESGRLLLVGDYIKSTPFVTGTVVGLLGMEADPGTFQVLDICYPRVLNQPPAPFPMSIKETVNKNNNMSILKNDNNKIALISGLNINTTSASTLLRIRLLQEYLNGSLYGENKSMSTISRLIICGNSVEFDINNKDQGKLAKSLDQFGDFLGNVLQSIPVDILPGANDPSDKGLPQQPLHKALFRDSLKPYFDNINKSLLNLVTNPYKFKINGWDLLTLSGQSINDIMKYVIPYVEPSRENKDVNDDAMEVDSTADEDSMEHRLDLMECTMKWQNIVPTSPDTLWCYPYKGKDPFIMDEYPHLYIVGNQPKFDKRMIEMSKDIKIQMITLPIFSETGEFVLLDLKTLDTEVIKLDI
ncbi:DNA polymerase delta small subunit [Monosporozyma servazzii]